MTYPLHIQRYVVALYVNRFSMREIFARTGIPVGSVHVILKRRCPKSIRPQHDTRNNSTRLSSRVRAAIRRADDPIELPPRSRASPGTTPATPPRPPLRPPPARHDTTNA